MKNENKRRKVLRICPEFVRNICRGRGEKNENKRRKVLRMERLSLTQYRLGCVDVDPVRVNCISAFPAVNV